MWLPGALSLDGTEARNQFALWAAYTLRRSRQADSGVRYASLAAMRDQVVNIALHPSMDDAR